MESSFAPPNPPAQPPLPPKRRRRWWRIFAILFVLFVALVFALPHAVAFDFVRAEAQAGLSQALGVPCRIDRIGFSWFSGFGAQGIEIDNPPGFSRDAPCLRIARVGGQLGLPSLFGGRLDFAGTIDGLQIRVEEDAEGRTNFAALGGSGVAIAASGSGSSSGSGSRQRRSGQVQGLANLQFDLSIREALIEIRRQGELIEALTQIHCSARKTFASDQLRVEFAANLQPLTAAGASGNLSALVDVDLSNETADARLTAAGLDLARYRPLLDALWPEQLTALAGIADGNVRADVRGDGDVQVDGSMTVRQPHLAGPLVHGMDLRAERWVLTPTIAFNAKAATDGAIATERFDADLGFARIRGVAADALPAELGETPPFVFRVEADLDALARCGGPMPQWLTNSQGKVDCLLSLPDLRSASLDELLSKVVVLATASAKGLQLGGYDLRAMQLTSTLRDGKLQLGTTDGSSVNAGPITAALSMDLTAATRPATLRLQWNDGQLSGPLAELFRYVVPLLAGVDASTTDLRGLASLQFELQGPTVSASNQNWLQLLDAWSGQGHVSLQDASFRPAPALQALLQPLGPALATSQLGEEGRLNLDKFATAFRLRQGQVETSLSEWLAHGQKVGLAGKVSLDGTMSYGLDFTQLLAAHRDGSRVLTVLGGKLPQAQLTGSLTAPKLQLPDLTTALRDGAGKALEKSAGELLRKSIDDLFKKR